MRPGREIFKREWCVFLFAFICYGWSFGQDTIAVLPAVNVDRDQHSTVRIAQVHTATPVFFISKETLEQLGSNDVGDALKIVPGAQVKDYGGVGGIKTVSYRSLGSTHTGVVIDGNPQPDTQIGSVSLSNFETFGLHQLLFSTGQPNALFTMPSAYIPANTIHIKTALMSFDTTLNYELFQRIATVNNFMSGLRLRVPIKKDGFIGTQLFATYGDGEYKYRYNLAGSDQIYTRENSTVINLRGKFAAGYRWKGFDLTGTFYYNYNDQQLPGAVILYNPSNDQTIHNNDYRADVNFILLNNVAFTRFNFFTQSNHTLYEDPEFLNSEGFWRSDYLQRRHGAGVVTNFIKKLPLLDRIAFGADLYMADLKSNEFSNAPLRYGVNSVLAVESKLKRLLLESNLTHQLIYDQARSGDSTVTTWFSKLAPYAAFRWYLLKDQFLSVRGAYKRVFRMPSFNDLYYNFIGNTNLKPETGDLFNFGFGHTFNFRSDTAKQNILEVSVDGFFNLVQNKIIAIPTKDIFNWSMQNIGRTRATGADISVLYARKSGNWNSSLSASLTINHAVDISDSTTSSFANQIPYTPLIASGVNLLVGWKGYTLSNNIIYTGARYSLNENIPVNYLAPFIDWGLGLSKEFDFGKGYQFYLSAKMMNVLGYNYEVVRSFPMPGRYYQFTFKLKYK